MRLGDGICKWEIWDHDGDKVSEPSGQVLIGYICVLLFFPPERRSRGACAAGGSAGRCDGSGLQWSIDYAASHPGGGSSSSSERLCLKNCYKCSPLQFFVFFLWECVPCWWVMHSYACASAFFVKSPKGSASGLRSSFEKRPEMVVSCEVLSHVSPLKGLVHL